MLENPNTMPLWKKPKDQKNLHATPKQKRKLVPMRQNEKSKHKQPSIYVDTKVEKRKS